MPGLKYDRALGDPDRNYDRALGEDYSGIGQDKSELKWKITPEMKNFLGSYNNFSDKDYYKIRLDKSELKWKITKGQVKRIGFNTIRLLLNQKRLEKDLTVLTNKR
jgi:hypothetical protein